MRFKHAALLVRSRFNVDTGRHAMILKDEGMVGTLVLEASMGHVCILPGIFLRTCLAWSRRSERTIP